MKLETFFEKFDQLADAPNAVAKMRELVLRLAVEGRLGTQQTQDSSAAEELAEFDLGIPELEPRFEVPDNWVWCPLDSLLLLMKNGFNGKPNKLGGQYKVTRIETIARETIDLNRIGFADDLPIAIVEKHQIKKGDILFSHINSEPHLGKTAICTLDDSSLIHGVNLLLLRTKKQIDPRYLNIAFRELRSSGYFISIAQRAINQSSINQKNLGKTLVPVPPLAEQKRIVAKVDELMALCDRLEAQQQERDTCHAALARASLARFAEAPTPANLDFLFHQSYTITPADLRKSILTLAVQGKLVPQDPNDEPAEGFLRRTKVRRTQQSNASTSRRTIETLEIAKDEIPFAIPKSWAWCRLDAIADKVTDGEHLSPVKTTSGMPLLTATHVTAKGLTLDNPQYVSVEDGHKSRQRCDPQRGDILICSRGTIGRCAVIETDAVFCLMGSVILVRFPVESAPRYFNYFLSTDLAQTEMRGMSGATAVQALYLKDIRQSLVPIPPLAEQRRIVAKVDQLMVLVDQLETQLAASRATAAKLMEAVVAELTVQN